MDVIDRENPALILAFVKILLIYYDLNMAIYVEEQHNQWLDAKNRGFLLSLEGAAAGSTLSCHQGGCWGF